MPVGRHRVGWAFPVRGVRGYDKPSSSTDDKHVNGSLLHLLCIYFIITKNRYIINTNIATTIAVARGMASVEEADFVVAVHAERSVGAGLCPAEGLKVEVGKGSISPRQRGRARLRGPYRYLSCSCCRHSRKSYRRPKRWKHYIPFLSNNSNSPDPHPLQMRLSRHL